MGMKKTIYLLAGILLAMACQKQPVHTTPAQMNIQFVHPDAATKVSETAFQSGDQIGLFVVETPHPLQISGNYVNNLKATYNGTNWTGSQTLRWPSTTSVCDLYGYYPHMDITSITATPFSVLLDQRDGFSACDFLWGKVAAQAYTTEAIPLVFKHKLTKVTLKLRKGPDYVGDFPANAVFYIHSTVPTATIDFATGSVTKDSYGKAETITCHKVSDDTYEAVIVPQRLSSRVPLFEMVANGVSYLVEGSFNFKPELNYTFDVTLNASTESIRIEIGGEIDNWQ